MPGEKRYYEAYDLRFRQVHEAGLTWFGTQPTAIVAQTMAKHGVRSESPVLEIGCGEGRDAAALLDAGCNLLATDVSPEAIRFCRETYPQWAEHFAALDCLKDDLDQRFDFIYAVAVLHMLVPDEDRQALLRFIRNHLTADGVGLVVVLGDGEMQRATDVNAAFDVQERIHEASGRMLQIASTSCRIVTRAEFRAELARAELEIIEIGDTSWDDAAFNMYTVVKRGD